MKIICKYLLLMLIFLSGCSKEQPRSKFDNHLKISAVVGSVQIISSSGKKRIARIGMLLYKGHTITTSGKNALCSMQTPSGSTIRLTKSSTLKIAKLYKNDQLKFEKTGIKLVLGTVLVKAKKLAGKNKLRVTTETAIAGVRGTQFVVTYHKKHGTAVLVKKGRVAVSRPITITLPDEHKALEKTVNRKAQEKTTVILTANKKIKVTKSENIRLNKKLQHSITRQIRMIKNKKTKTILSILNKQMTKETQKIPLKTESLKKEDLQFIQQFSKFEKIEALQLKRTSFKEKKASKRTQIRQNIKKQEVKGAEQDAIKTQRRKDATHHEKMPDKEQD